MKNRKKIENNRGMALIELVVALGIVALISVLAYNMIQFTGKTYTDSSKEKEIQENLRKVSMHVNETVRLSKGVYILYKEDANVLTPGWNYIMTSEDKNNMVEYLWDKDTAKHNKREFFAPVKDSKFEALYKKSTEGEKLLAYELDVNYKGDNKKVIDTELEALAAINVVDMKNTKKTANTLAYRTDDPSAGTVEKVPNVAITFIVDTSSSMGEMMNDKYDTRLELLQVEAKKMIEDLAEYQNTYISIVPFSTMAREDVPMQNMYQNKDSLLAYIDGIKASGYTNTGDGIRLGYHSLSKFNKSNTLSEKIEKNIAILLVDGNYNSFSFNEVRIAHPVPFIPNEIPYDYFQRTGIGAQNSDAIYTMYFGDKVATGNGMQPSTFNDEDFEVKEDMYGKEYMHNRKEILRTALGMYPKGDTRFMEEVNIYTKRMSEFMANYTSPNSKKIETYVVGFSDKAYDFATLDTLAGYLDAEKYTAENADELNLAFEEIVEKINVKDMWTMIGPS